MSIVNYPNQMHGHAFEIFHVTFIVEHIIVFYNSIVKYILSYHCNSVISRRVAWMNVLYFFIMLTFKNVIIRLYQYSHRIEVLGHDFVNYIIIPICYILHVTTSVKQSAFAAFFFSPITVLDYTNSDEQNRFSLGAKSLMPL